MNSLSLFPHQKLDWTISRLEEKMRSTVVDPALRLELARVTVSLGLFHNGGESPCARALGQAKKVLTEDPSSVEALTIAGLALLGMDRPDAAERYLSQALHLDPDRADLQLALGSLERNRGNFAAMLQFLENACYLAPKAWEPHLLLGRSLLAMGRKRNNQRDIEKSQFHLVQAIQNSSNTGLNSGLNRDLGLACLLTGRFREAERFFIRLREAPKYAGIARLYLGQVAYELGKYHNAIQHFRKYLDEKSDDANVIARMAMSWFQLEEYSRAREACHQALMLEPFNLLARHTLGCTLLEEGDPNEAIRVFKETLKEHPDHLPSYLEVVRTRRFAKDISWLHTALRREVANYDRQPLGGHIDARELTRDRIGVLLEEIQQIGPSSTVAVLSAIDHTQDEGLRFLLWEAACRMAETSVASETASALRLPGIHYGIALGEEAVSIGHVIPEHILTAGLDISEADLKKAAVERYDLAHDVQQHRQNLDSERDKARAYQALLLLSIAARGSDSGRDLLKEWSENADTEMAIAARIGLAMVGDVKSIQQLRRSARTREKLEAFQRLLEVAEPAARTTEPHRVKDDVMTRCKTCERTTGQVSHMMTGGGVVICSVCIHETWKNREDLIAPDDAICHLCSRSYFESSGVYRFRGTDICGICIQFSMGMQEREEVERYFSS